MIAVVPVRGGELPDGGAETVAEAGGIALLIGEGVAEAANELGGVAIGVGTCEAGAFAPGAWADALAPYLVGEAVVLLPGSPDGRDLAPRLAHALGWPYVAGAIRVSPGSAVVVRHGGLVAEHLAVEGPFVVTLQPGARGVEAYRGSDGEGGQGPRFAQISPLPMTVEPVDGSDAVVLEVLAADPATVDLAEAERIVSGGAGLGSPEAFVLLREVGLVLGAATGGTRVVTDWEWLEFERQIGTTGVSVNPSLYVAFGVSGAVQHVSGLGHPDHVVSINLDPSCPMTALADLALVADAPATLNALAELLGLRATEADPERAPHHPSAEEAAP